ncbi:hypothetical protein EDD29_0432 [Actinocorallia herbida]|uniref:ScoMcrA-like SRA domain-containing protein n=1 Tax=Actinocorallia herbida TaxID=58109 RepID=A0A3N1CP24_9ACTN|nr:hypothetical protein [Actinocorallia herbida]ROO82945.1 hypothetical protein EDD29_0432 [Actinocorallia herbida]
MSTQSLELVPGMLTTRAEVATAYGGSRFSGIEVSKKTNMIFIYSDPEAGEEYGYTFDGLAEPDEQGPLYLYTGEGKEDQELTKGNASLHRAREDGRPIHLFVADGVVVNEATGRKTGTKQQRYLGQMMLDEVQPFEMRRAVGPSGERHVIVFRFRPDSAARYPAVFQARDGVRAASKTEQVTLEVEPTSVMEARFAASVQVETEAHHTNETVAKITGGLSTVVRREGELTTAYKDFLVERGHTVKRFQITVAGVAGALMTDLYDVTDNVLYEAKGAARRTDVRLAIGQLLDYRRHIETPPGLRLAVLLPSEPGDDLRDLLQRENIALVTRTADGFAGFPVGI